MKKEASWSRRLSLMNLSGSGVIFWNWGEVSSFGSANFLGFYLSG